MTDILAAAAKADPLLDAGIRGFIFSTARKELWRVGDWYTLDDLISDGLMCFYKCRRRYAVNRYGSMEDHTTHEQQKWLMALVKTTFYRHIAGLAEKQMMVKETPASQLRREEQTEEQYLDGVAPSQGELGSMATLIASAPQEIKTLVLALANDGAEFLGYKREKKHRRALRETNNEYFCRLVGLDPKEYDFVGQVESYFGLTGLA